MLSKFMHWERLWMKKQKALLGITSLKQVCLCFLYDYFTTKKCTIELNKSKVKAQAKTTINTFMTKYSCELTPNEMETNGL